MIRELILNNWMAFRGEHRILLGRGAYAITASRVAAAELVDGTFVMRLNPRSSNACGKSALLEAIRYALDGTLQKHRGFDVDGWITHGEREGSVTLVLDDGASITRSKKHGQSRQVRVRLPGMGEASQEGADAAIRKYLCMTGAEFRNGPYIEQKEASRMVHADPLDRTLIVNAWLGLAKAEDAEDRTSAIASEIAMEVQALVAKCDVLREGITSDEAIAVDADTTAKEAELRERAGDRMVYAKAIRYATTAAKVVAQHDEAKAEAKRLRGEISAIESKNVAERAATTSEKAETARADEAKARREVADRKKVSLGLFDGACPVAPIDCPAKKRINDSGEVTRAALVKAEKELERARTNRVEAEKSAEGPNAELRALEAKQAELRAAVRRVSTGADEAERARQTVAKAEGTSSDADAAFDEAVKFIGEADALSTARRMEGERQKRLDAARKRLATLVSDLEAARTRQRAATRAKAVFRAAARRVAEDALGGIEADANAAIARAGVNLVVRARFEREGKDLAKSCDQCGAPFPKSAKVKVCEQCAEPRGLATKQRLDFVMSEASGALWDIAGVTWQACAAAWLLKHRASPWRTLIADEPTSACDFANREGMIRVLGQMVTGGVFDQLLFVSHDAASADALPHRILIEEDRDGRRHISVV